jgi:HPt (histidine-containing phosphotransfer) domain-containing protein
MADEIGLAARSTTQGAPQAASWTLPSFLDSLPAEVRLEMLALYRDGLREQMARLEVALAGGAGFPAAASMAHKIAGAAGMMQDRALAEVAQLLEEQLRGEIQAGVAELAERLSVRARLSLAIIEQVMA